MDPALALERLQGLLVPRGRRASPAGPRSVASTIGGVGHVEVLGDLGAETAEVQQPLAEETDARGLLQPEGLRRLCAALRIGARDAVFAVGDGLMALALALAARPRLVFSATDNAAAHVALVEVLERASSEKLGGAAGATAFRAELALSVESLAELAGASDATIVMLLGIRLQGRRLLELTRALASKLAPGAAVVVPERWLHCHAGLVGPVWKASLPFARLPRGGRVFVYLVAPRLLVAPGMPSVFEPDADALEPLLEGLPEGGQEALAAWVASRSTVGSAAAAEGVRRMLRLLPDAAAGGGAAPPLWRWALGRALGSAASPLECVLKDAFFLAAGSEQGAAKLGAEEATSLGRAAAPHSEVSPASLKRLLEELPPLAVGDVVVDLSAGIGKAVFQVALTLPVLARGVEASPTRHANAEAAWALLADAGARAGLGPVGEELLRPAPPGRVELLRRGFAPDSAMPDALWRDASVVLFRSLADAATAPLRFDLAAAVARGAAVGAALVSLAPLQGCHRGLRLVRAPKVRVDWSPSPVPAYLYVVTPRPEEAQGTEAAPEAAALELSGASQARLSAYRCLSRAALAAGDAAAADFNASERLRWALRVEASSKHRGADWLAAGWFRGDAPSTWECLFQDLEQLLDFEAGPSGAGTRDYWRDSTSANADRGLRDLSWSALGGPRTYGEILPSSVARLLEELRLGSEDVFYDLGSGVGKVVLQVHLQSRVKRAAGIELEESRHRAAERLLERLRRLGLAGGEAQEVRFRLGDATEAALWADATVVFMLCTCFPPEVLAKIAAATAVLPLGTRLVAASFPVDLIEGTTGGHVLRLQRHLVLPTTFSMGEPFFIYEVVETGPSGQAPRSEAARAAEAFAAQMGS